MKRTTMTASSRERCFTDLISFNPTTPCHVRSTASVLYAGCLGLRKAVAPSPVTWRTVAQLHCVPDPPTLESNVLPAV